MDKEIISVSILGIIICAILLAVIILGFRPKKQRVYSSVLFSLLTLSIVFLGYMFRHLSPIIKQDILGDVYATFNNTGIVSPIVAPIIATIGILIGYSIQIVLNYLKNENFKSKFKKKK